jgi:hypothetical protein
MQLSPEDAALFGDDPFAELKKVDPFDLPESAKPAPVVVAEPEPVPEPAAVIPPDAPANDAATPAPVKRGRKAKAAPELPFTGGMSDAVGQVVSYVPTPTLRDQFAIAAIGQMAAHFVMGSPASGPEAAAKLAYSIADAMLAERERKA